MEVRLLEGDVVGRGGLGRGTRTVLLEQREVEPFDADGVRAVTAEVLALLFDLRASA